MHLKILPRSLGHFFLCLLLIGFYTKTHAEGTKQLDPNSTDYTKLMTNNAAYGSFAQYDGTVNSRLFVHVANPNSELVYLGFSRGAVELFDPFNAYLGDDVSYNYYFRIVSPSGVIVYGPTLIDGSSANVNSRADAVAGPAPIVGGSGYTPFTFDPTGMAAGDYYIEISDQANALSTTLIDIPFFDITVANNSGASPVAVDGRLWSYNWALKTTPTTGASTSPYGNFDRAFNGIVYAYTDDGFVNKIDFANSGFRGWFFTIAFNANGTGTSGEVAEDRKSVPNSYSVSPQYQIFLNDPDETEYPSGILGTLQLAPQINICDPGDICVWVEATLEGQVEIILDMDATSGAGNYDLNTADVLLLTCITAQPGETAPYRRCVEWDGLDGLGVTVDLGSNVDVYAKLQQGVTHYASYDVEFVVDGYAIDIIRPTGGVFVDNLYYDDSDIPFLPGNGADQIALDGCTAPCHSWTNFDYGNVNTINTWWISHTSEVQNAHLPWCVPTAHEDTTFTAASTPVVIDVMDNDQGFGLWAGSVNVTTQPINGSVSVNTSTGEITYTPNAGYTGEDFFWYEVCNPDSPPVCDDTWVVININGITAINDDNNTMINLGVSGNVLTNDVDNEGDNITLNTTLFSDPANGMVSINSNGTYTYTPTTDYVGQDQFEYIICDDGTPSACDTAAVVITITDEPSFSNNEVIANADEAITNVDVAVMANVLANDADVDGDNLTVNTIPISNPSHGTVTLLANGDYTYTPSTGFAGQDEFTYEVCDDGIPQACASAVVVIDIVPDLNGSLPSDPFAGDDFNVTDLNTNVSGDLSTNDFGGGTISTTTVSSPSHGMVSINSNGTYTYTPTTSYTGPDQFVYTTCASGSGNSTDAYSSTDIPVTIIDLATVSSDLTINSGGSIQDINLANLKITHSYIGDVTIALVSPAGTRATLIANVCSSSQNFDVTFDDEGSALILCSDLVSGANYQPFNDLLSVFDGENSAGTWKLEVSDNFGGDNGTIDSWSLEIETSNEVCVQATAYILVIPPPVTDLDEDDDGIPDLQEVFIGDHDMDGTPDYADSDFCAAVFHGVNGWDCANGLPDPDFDLDGDGMPNIIDTDYPYTIPDTDGDGYYDYLDLDADNDGIPDLIEAGGTDIDGDGVVDSSTDSDNDGLVDIYDPTNTLNSGVNEGPALVVIDTDGDSYPNYLDLDADNDGIPDLIESGSADANGDGMVDDLTDSDSDGLVNLYDPSNDTNTGSNEGIPHFVTGADSGDGTPTDACTLCNNDADSQPPYIDLDADDDGILDIIEAGGTDADNDGMIADAVGDNGYSNGLDPEDGGTPYFTVGADDAGDGDARPEYTSAAGIGDSDGDDVPDFLDVDADNDGIYDNYEAQATTGYTPPSGFDTDKDGIDDAYDADDLAATNGLNPYNHDLSDQPDYLDEDADNDNISDWQEAWDHLFDGDSQADNLTTSNGVDSDGDGLLDVYDANDASAADVTWEDDPANDLNGSTGMSAGTLFSDNLLLLLPENGGNDMTQPDYRDQLIECGVPLVYYALTEMGGSTASYAYNKATDRHELNAGTGETRATTYCERDGWFYYYNPLEPTNYLFAVKYNASNPGTIPINELIDYIEIRVDDNPAGRQIGNGSTAQLVLPRDWHVVFKGTPEVEATYDIKFYFDPQELVNLDAAADALAGQYNARELKWFKADQGDGTSFSVSDIAAGGITNMVDITPNASVVVNENNGNGLTDGTSTVDAGNGKNYISFIGLPGFSGGTASISMSAILPVELSSFKAIENNCQVDLTWVTKSEENFSHFEVQRSEDARAFVKVATLASLSSSSGNAYFIKDEPQRGNHYYRLKIVDLDGTYSYSEVVSTSIKCGRESKPIEIYPNPIQGDLAILNVAFESPTTNPTFQILDLFGRAIKSKKVIAEKGWMKTSIEVGDLQPGTYYLVSKDIGMEYGSKFLIID